MTSNILSGVRNALGHKIAGPLGGKLDVINMLREQAGAETFDAARHGNNYRGYFYLPQLEPKKAMDTFTRLEIGRKSVWLENNVGMAKSIIRRTARYEVGTGLWPIPRTADKDFNRRIKRRFHAQNFLPKFFDVAAGYNFYSGQLAVRKHIKRHGDFFTQLVRSPGDTAMMRFIPGYAVGNVANSDLDQSRWVDGVYPSPLGRPLQFRVLGQEQGKFEDISADYMLHQRDSHDTGAVRGVGILAHACRHMFTIDDVLRYASQGMKMEQQIGYWIQLADEAVGGPRFTLPGTEAPQKIENSDGSSYTTQRIFSGEGSLIPQMPKGSELKVIESNRPGTNTLGFLDYLCRDIAWGSDYAPEFIHNLAGVGGAPIRYIYEDVQMTIDEAQQFQIIPQYCDPYYRFWLYLELLSGREKYSGEDWAEVDWQTPRKVTADKGNAGKLDDDRYGSGKMSGAKYHGQAGNDVDDEDEAVVDDYFRRQALIADKAEAAGIPAKYEDIFPRPPGSAPAVVAPEPPAVEP